MRFGHLALLATATFAGPAAAEPLPPGSLELFTGAASGTGADAKRLGHAVPIYGGWLFGASAAWQPTSTERRWGWSLRWSTLFGSFYDGDAAKVNPPLRVVQMDLTAGLRFRPWPSPSRYLTARGGVGLFRSNDPIVIDQRAFVGPVAAVGFDQYFGTLVVGVDVRYGLITNGPTELALVVRLGLAGP